MRCQRKKVPEENMVKLRARASKVPCIEKSSARFVPARAEKAGRSRLESKQSLSVFRKRARNVPKYREDPANAKRSDSLVIFDELNRSSARKPSIVPTTCPKPSMNGGTPQRASPDHVQAFIDKRFSCHFSTPGGTEPLRRSTKAASVFRASPIKK